MSPRITNTNKAIVTYIVTINLAKGNKVANPYFPIAKAIPPKAPRGAKYITHFNPRKTKCVNLPI